MGAALRLVIGYAIGSFVAKFMLSLGIAFTTYQGLSYLLDGFLSELTSAVGGLSADIYNILGLFGLWEGISIVGGALVAIAAVKSMKVFIGVAPS